MDTTQHSLYSAFGTDKDLESNGVVLDFGVVKVKVRRAGGSNRAFVSALSAKMRPHRRSLENNTMSEELALSLQLDVYFDTVVVGWEGVTDRGGNPLPYTRENFKAVMADLPDFWAAVRNEADNMRNFQREQAAEDGKQLGE